MVTCKVADYLTFTIMPGSVDCGVGDLLQRALDCTYLNDLWEKNLFEFKCNSKYYSAIYRYGDIQIKVPYEDNFKSTGICFELSGHGVEFYEEYLATYYVKVDLRHVVRRVVALSKFGYKTKGARMDVAFDQIIREGETEEPLLSLDRVRDSLQKGAFVSTFRKSDAVAASGKVQSVFTVNPNSIDESLPFRFIESTDLSSGMIGKTIELGRRKSSSFVRFYDKLVEQSVKKQDVTGISYWVRCEIEFKHTNANSVFLLYAMSDNDKDFADKIRGKIFSLIRFVDLDRSRKYNCTVCQWWVDFLNSVKPYKLAYNKRKYNKYIRSLDHQMRRNSSSLAALLMCNSGNIKSIIAEGFKHQSKTSKAILSDYNAVRSLSQEEFEEVYSVETVPLVGFDFWRQFVPDDFTGDFDSFFADYVAALSDELEAFVIGLSARCACGV